MFKYKYLFSSEVVYQLTLNVLERKSNILIIKLNFIRKIINDFFLLEIPTLH